MQDGDPFLTLQKIVEMVKPAFDIADIAADADNGAVAKVRRTRVRCGITSLYKESKPGRELSYDPHGGYACGCAAACCACIAWISCMI